MKTTDTFASEDDILGYNIMVAAGLMVAESNALLRKQLHINMRQYIALRQLRAEPDLGSAELGHRLFITPQSTGPVLDGLERLGYIMRSGNESPGLKMAVRLTERGEAVLLRGDQLIEGLEAAHRMRLSPKAVADLNGLLTRLIGTLRAERPRK